MLNLGNNFEVSMDGPLEFHVLLFWHDFSHHIHFSCQSVHLIINVTMVIKINYCQPVYHCVEKFILFLVRLSRRRRLKCTIVIIPCRSSVYPSLTLTFSTSPLKPLYKIQQNLTGSKISTSIHQVCVFWTDQKNKMATLSSDWLRHFRFLLWNCWWEFDETW